MKKIVRKLPYGSVGDPLVRERRKYETLAQREEVWIGEAIDLSSQADVVNRSFLAVALLPFKQFLAEKKLFLKEAEEKGLDEEWVAKKIKESIGSYFRKKNGTVPTNMESIELFELAESLESLGSNDPDLTIEAARYGLTLFYGKAFFYGWLPSLPGRGQSHVAKTFDQLDFVCPADLADDMERLVSWRSIVFGDGQWVSVADEMGDKEEILYFPRNIGDLDEREELYDYALKEFVSKETGVEIGQIETKG